MNSASRLACASVMLLTLPFLACCAAKYSRIMTYEEYRSLGRRAEPRAYVGHSYVRPDFGPDPDIFYIKASLIYYASAHFNDPEDPQANEIEWFWDVFQPQIALNEGGDPPVAPTREEAISRYGEAGLLRFLAARDGVPIRNIDPTKQEEVAHLLARHTPEELKVFFALQAVAQDATRPPAFRETSPEACAEHVLTFYGRIAGLGGAPTTVSELVQSCARLLPQLADWRTVDISWFDPALEKPLAFTNAIARDSSVHRDRFMVDLLEGELWRHQRVFAVAGLSHVIMQQRELEARIWNDLNPWGGMRPDTTIIHRMVYMSRLGKPLVPPSIDAARRAELDAKLKEYRALIVRPDATEDDFIWCARTLGYLHKYSWPFDWYNADDDNQIGVCTLGLKRFPESYKLLRHRGHRYLTVRDFARAIEDLSHAAKLIEEKNIPDEVEPDGIPNARGVPRSTSHTNIYYHLGLAHYLTGGYFTAADAFKKCIAWSRNDDMLCAATHWLYWSLRRDGRESEALVAVAGIHADMEIFENATYRDLCFLYKGERTPEQLAPQPADFSTIEPALAYGLAAWRYSSGDLDGALRDWRAITENPNWPAFGVIAAESEIAARFPPRRIR